MIVEASTLEPMNEAFFVQSPYGLGQSRPLRIVTSANQDFAGKRIFDEDGEILHTCDGRE